MHKPCEELAKKIVEALNEELITMDEEVIEKVRKVLLDYGVV